MKRTAAVIAAVALVPMVLLAQRTSSTTTRPRTSARSRPCAQRRNESGRPADRQADRRRHRSGARRQGRPRPPPTPTSPSPTIAFDKKQGLTAYSTAMGGTVTAVTDGAVAGHDRRPRQRDPRRHDGDDVANPAKNEIVWRGMGVKEVDVQAKADKRDKNIASAVKKILKDFPPKPKK